MASSGPHDDETRAKVLGDLRAAVPISEIARRHGVSRPTIRAWRAEAGLSGMPLVSTDQREDLGALVVAQAAETFLSLQAVVKRLRDPDFLGKQTAADLVAIHRELADGAVGWLEGLHPAGADAAEPPGGAPDGDGAPPPRAAGAPDAAA